MMISVWKFFLLSLELHLESPSCWKVKLFTAERSHFQDEHHSAVALTQGIPLLCLLIFAISCQFGFKTFLSWYKQQAISAHIFSCIFKKFHKTCSNSFQNLRDLNEHQRRKWKQILIIFCWGFAHTSLFVVHTGSAGPLELCGRSWQLDGVGSGQARVPAPPGHQQRHRLGKT